MLTVCLVFLNEITKKKLIIAIFAHDYFLHFMFKKLEVYEWLLEQQIHALNSHVISLI